MAVLRARIGGAWVDVGGAASADEVWIGTDAPPDANAELWYDTDEPTVLAYGLESAKPATPPAPQTYFATDTKRSWFFDGTGWVIMGEPGVSWTPTYTSGITVGSGSSVGWYHRSDGFCDIWGRFTLGAGSAVTGAVVVALPFAPQNLAINWLNIGYFDGNLYYTGMAGDSASPQFYPVTATQTYVQITGTLGPSAPFVWAAGHQIQFHGRYRMASRYT